MQVAKRPGFEKRAQYYAAKAYKSDHIVLYKDSLEHDLQDFSFTFLELPKFKLKINEYC